MIAIRKKYLYRYIIPACILLFAGALAGAGVWYSKHFNIETESVFKIDKSQFNSLRLTDNTSLYTDTDQKEPINIYLTTFKGANAVDGKIYDFDDLSGFRLPEQGEPEIAANVKIGNAGAYVLGGETDEANCEVTLRGQSARKVALKSYKIKIYDNSGSFQGQKTLNLNKHYSDPTKIKNKLCFDIISMLPDMISLRTTFFHLYVRDVYNGNTFVDYGLFTHVEQPDKNYLRSHGLDPNGTLYKPSDFEFFKEDAILPEDDPSFDMTAFRKYLKVRENSDNKKLLKMVTDINDPKQNFDEVFDKYFDKDNYLTWIAMNLLVDNYDTMSRNYLLYSPSYSDKWYMLPWDYDGTLFSAEERAGKGLYHFYGIERYWGTTLHNRFFRNPDNVKALDQKVEQIYKIMSSDKTQKLIDDYELIALKYLAQPPDGDIYSSLDRSDAAIDSLPDIITENYYRYFESKERPMPYFLGTPKKTDKGWYFNWNPSFDLQGDSISYSIKVAKDPEMTELVFKADNLYTTEVYSTAELAQGTYFWTVAATDSKGNSQTPFEYYRGEGTAHYHGVKKLVVE